MKLPASLLLSALAAALLLLLVEIEAVGVAFHKLGLSTTSAGLWIAVSIFGSFINIPLCSWRRGEPPRDYLPPPLQRLLRMPRHPAVGRTVLAVNVGGGVVPVASSAYLFRHAGLDMGTSMVATGLVAVVCRFASRPLTGVGIGVPIFVPPLTAAGLALLIDPEKSAALAYVCGTLGVLIGADLTRLHEIRQMGAPVASIGGAGTFDGIFLTGLVAVLLA